MFVVAGSRRLKIFSFGKFKAEKARTAIQPYLDPEP